MAVEVLGISGSPILNSNTDRAVQAILKSTGLTADFIKLSSLRLEPCRACLSCVQTNECIMEDDGKELAHRFREAKAFVLGGFTPTAA